MPLGSTVTDEYDSSGRDRTIVRTITCTHSINLPMSRPALFICHAALRFALVALTATVMSHSVGAQGAGPVGAHASGPVINAAGPSFLVQDPTFATPARGDMKALFEINAGGGDTVKVNEQLVSMARFFNHQARNGVAESRLKAAAVFHGGGWTALLTDSAFAARFGGKPNPSRQLVEELLQHGAQLVLCGQTAGARSIRRDELLPGVKVAVSAMTAMIVLQNEGYRFIPW